MRGRTVALVMVLATLVVACGDGGDDQAGTGSTPAPEDSATSTVAADPGVEQDPADGSLGVDEECTGDALANGTVSTVGYDEVVFGMTVAAAEEASGACLVADRSENQDCFHVVPSSGPAGLSFLVTAGTIERVDVFEGDITTRSGLGIGSTEQAVIEQLGSGVEVRPHPSGGGNELVFVPSDEGDAEFRVVFETNGSTVTRFRSGRRPQVDETLACPGGDELSSAPTTTSAAGES